MSNKKQTAVEFLVKKLNKFNSEFRVAFKEEIEQAKKMEKEQIEDAFCDGVVYEYEHHINGIIIKNSEQYYNETFKNK